VLSESVEQLEAAGFGPERLSSALESVARQEGMPVDTSLRPRIAISAVACRAVVAARLRAPGQLRALLRALRVRNFSGELLDAPETIDAAARDAGLDPEQLWSWMSAEDAKAAFEEDKRLARSPKPAARILDHKLAGPEEERRYTCPSYELSRGDVQLTAPGFQPFSIYETLVANLLPDVARNPEPESVEQVLAWAGHPLATKEVMLLCGLDEFGARQALSRVATERPVGASGFWFLKPT
jgi:hypothetical protein